MMVRDMVNGTIVTNGEYIFFKTDNIVLSIFIICLVTNIWTRPLRGPQYVWLSLGPYEMLNILLEI